MQNKSTIKSRLAEFLAYLGIGQAKFAEIVGLSKGFANNIGKSIRTDNLQKIAEMYPQLDTDWLIYGRGEMLKTDTKEPAPVSDIIEIPREVFNQINGLIETVKSQQESIRSLTNVAESFSRIEEKIDSREGVVSKAGDVL